VMSFGYTGGVQSFVVPAGVTSITVSVSGAAGGPDGYGTQPGLGATVTATLAVTPGTTLTLQVGGVGGAGTDAVPGSGGYNGGGAGGADTSYAGGGGGGASDIRMGGTASSTRVIVAAGGGVGAGVRAALLGRCPLLVWAATGVA
jgi:hypothetical protein